MSYNLSLKGVYDFSMRAGPILGYTYKSAEVLGLLDYESAKALQDVAPLHAQVYSQLPAGTPKDPAALVWVKLRTSSGEVRVFAMDWIAEQPTLVTTKDVIVTIPQLNLSDLPRLRDLITANFGPGFEIAVAS